jgi:hypothetical protein
MTVRRAVDSRIATLGAAGGLLVGWGALGSAAISLIASAAARVAERLDGVGYRVAPASLAFTLVFGILSWSALWAAAGAKLARVLATRGRSGLA